MNRSDLIQCLLSADCYGTVAMTDGDIPTNSATKLVESIEKSVNKEKDVEIENKTDNIRKENIWLHDEIKKLKGLLWEWNDAVACELRPDDPLRDRTGEVLAEYKHER